MVYVMNIKKIFYMLSLLLVFTCCVWLLHADQPNLRSNQTGILDSEKNISSVFNAGELQKVWDRI